MCGASPGCFGDQGRDVEAFVHGAVGAVGIVGGVGRLGQDVESCPVSRPVIGAKIADVSDAAEAQQFRQQQGQKGVQGRNGFRTGQARLTHRVGKIQSEQLWDEQKQARDLGGELPIGGQGPLLHVSATAGTSEPSRACSPGCSWARQRCPLGATPASCNRRKR